MTSTSRAAGPAETWRDLARGPVGAAAACALAGLAVFQFWGNAPRGYIDTGSLFWWWGWQWFNPGSESEHGPLILALAAWVAGRNLRGGGKVGARTADIAAREKLWPAVAALLGGLTLHLAGFTMQQTRISIVAWLLFVWGVFRLGGGRRWAGAVGFPLALMLCAVPLNFLDTVGFHLRLQVIQATTAIAHLVGIDVVRNGTQLLSPDGAFQYDVAAACSGVRSLLALLALSALIGYLELKSTWRRLAVFLLSIPLTYVGNVVRVSLVVLVGEMLGHDAGALAHDYAGFIVFVVVLGGVHGASTWLARAEEKTERTESLQPLNSPASAAPSAPPRPECNVLRYNGHRGAAWWVAAGVGVLAIGVVVAAEWLASRAATARAGVKLAANGVDPADLPVFVGTEWAGRRVEVSAVERDVLPPDTGYSRRLYQRLEDAEMQVFFSVVLSGRDRSSIHRPELCLVGQGWTILGAEERTLRDPRDGRALPVRWLQIEKEFIDTKGTRQRVPARFAYWFSGRDTVVATTARRMWLGAWHRLRLQPDRWAYVVAQTAVRPTESDASVQARVQEIVDGAWLEIAEPLR